MERAQLEDIIATKNAPLVVEEGCSEKYRRVVIKEEGYVIVMPGAFLEMEELVIHEQNPEYDIVAKGSDGEDGGPGEDGTDASDGGEIEVIIGALSNNIKVLNCGGNGGDGGFGGKGGDGGNGFCNGKGAPGGVGGDGGDGGNGGRGPHLTLKYFSSDPVRIEEMYCAGRGGEGGAPGQGGKGGRDGNADTYAQSGKPGQRGSNGEPGEKGSIDIIKLDTYEAEQ